MPCRDLASRMKPAVWLLLPAVWLGCSGKPQPAAKPASEAAALVRYPLPVKPFSAPKAWKPLRGDAKPVPAPALSELTWYVLVDQYEPHQRATPAWQPLSADRTVEVDMPAGSMIRCVAPPLEITATANDFGSALEYWFLDRSVICSSDGFKTWSSYPHRVRLKTDGTRELDYRADGWLSERAPDGSVRNTVVSLRAEIPRREATTGPPRVLSEATESSGTR